MRKPKIATESPTPTFWLHEGIRWAARFILENGWNDSSQMVNAKEHCFHLATALQARAAEMDVLASSMCHVRQSSGIKAGRKGSPKHAPRKP